MRKEKKGEKKKEERKKKKEEEESRDIVNKEQKAYIIDLSLFVLGFNQWNICFIILF
jgi:hypothetical protein